MTASTVHAGSLLQLRGMERGEVVGILERAAGFVCAGDGCVTQDHNSESCATQDHGSERCATQDHGSERRATGMVATMFFEDSTRTRLSFEVAARRLGVGALDIGPSSSTSKGESLVDSAKTIEAMGVDALIVRAKPSGSAHLIAGHVGVPVINAGDGRHEHPTQGLLDCLTLCEALGRDDFDMAGVRVAIVGDVVSSRVARSAIAGFGLLGAEVVCVGPGHLVPRSLEGLGCEVSDDFDAVVGEVDAVMMLRVQRERHGGRETKRRRDGVSWGAAGSVGAYRAGYALTVERAGRMRDGAVVMHPGPMNRGVEIDGEVADGARSLITRQVAMGVAVRMAVIERALGGVES